MSNTAYKVSVFRVILVRIFRIRTEHGRTLRISPYSVQMRGNTNQKNSKYGHFSRSEMHKITQTHLGPCQNPRWRIFAKIVNAYMLLTIFVKKFHHKRSTGLILLHEKCPYSEIFWSECGEIWTRKTQNTDTFQAVYASG